MRRKTIATAAMMTLAAFTLAGCSLLPGGSSVDTPAAPPGGDLITFAEGADLGTSAPAFTSAFVADSGTWVPDAEKTYAADGRYTFTHEPTGCTVTLAQISSAPEETVAGDDRQSTINTLLAIYPGDPALESRFEDSTFTWGETPGDEEVETLSISGTLEDGTIYQTFARAFSSSSSALAADVLCADADTLADGIKAVKGATSMFAYLEG